MPSDIAQSRLVVDHLVYATPDLQAATRELEERLGIRATEGGRHTGFGTHNVLMGLGEGYLEIIGQDPGQPPPAVPRPFGIDQLSEPRLVTWALRVVGIDEAVARSRVAGYDPGDPREMSGTCPDGVVLRWRLTPPASTADQGIVPFLIDWGETPHPARGPASVELVALRAEHPDVSSVAGHLRALGPELPVTSETNAALIATLRGPRGEITLR